MGDMTLYHLTDEKSVGLIKDGGYKMIRGSSGAFGGGIYFAESAKKCERKAHRRGWVIKAKVKMGKALVVNHVHDYTYTWLKERGFDSVYAPDGVKGGHAEFVVYNHAQVKILDMYKE